MQALIMAAGRGSRLGPETDVRPKSLVDLGGHSPLTLQIELLADRGLDHAIVVTGYRRELVESEVRRAAAGRFEVTAIWNPFWPVTNVLGSAWLSREQLHGPLVYLHADTVFHPSILDDMLSTPGDAALPVDMRPCEPEQMKAEVVAERVHYLSKELTDHRTAGEFIGVAYFRESAIASLSAGMDAVLADGKLAAYFEDAINWAIAERGLDARVVEVAGRPWTEIDFPEDLALARRILPELTR